MSFYSWPLDGILHEYARTLDSAEAAESQVAASSKRNLDCSHISGHDLMES